MESYQKEFIHFIVKRNALKFGEYQTKSGRLSPYFFNAGGLFSGEDLRFLGKFYAQALQQFFPDGVDLIYGPAYKGIPLSVSTCMAMHGMFLSDIFYCFNRKEAKDHGEKGTLVGKVPGPGERLVIVDDVITAGTSVRETMEILKGYEGVHLKGVLVALDRQEKGIDTDKSAMKQIEEEYGLPVFAIARLEHILQMLEDGELPEEPAGIIDKIKAYRETYGAS